MANMFSGNQRKPTPKSLAECKAPDETSSNLWIWAERLETWGKVFFVILIIWGVISAIVSAVEAQEVIDYLKDEFGIMYEHYAKEAGIEIPSVADIFFNELITWAFYAFLEYCTYHVIALLVAALATITQNTRIAANIALYNCAINENSSLQEAEETKSHMNDKAEEFVSNNDTETNAPDSAFIVKPNAQGFITCPSCNQIQKGDRTVCFECGTRFTRE